MTPPCLLPFHLNGRGARGLVLTYLDSPMAKVLPWKKIIFFLSILAIFRDQKLNQKLDQNYNFWVHPISIKIVISQRFFNRFFSLVLPLVKIHIWGKKGPKTSKMAISWMLNWYQKRNFKQRSLTWQPRMLHWWIAIRWSCIFTRSFIC